jgi:hypothetical protein
MGRCPSIAKARFMIFAESQKNLITRPAVCRMRQKGAAMLTLLLVVMVAAGYFGLRALNFQGNHAVLPDATERMLARAKEAVIATSISMGANLPSPGRMPFPDVSTTITSGDSPARNYDGARNSDCVTRTWVSGNTITGAFNLNKRCVGRLPWRDMGLQIDNLPPENDPDGVMPWYAFSPRLAPGGCTNVNSTLLNGTASCSFAWPWITVVDSKGNILTNRAAVVIIVPGPKLGSQNRTVSPVPDSSAYLDSVTVQPSCTLPCVPGTYNNAARRITGLTTAQDNAIGLRFIRCADINTVSSSSADFAQPYQCNDKLTYITADELMVAAERRALAEAKQQLLNFFSTPGNGYFPYAAPLGTIDCATGQLSGHIPSGATASNKCPASSPAFTTQSWASTWFDLNNWADVIYYHVAPSCIQSAPLPVCSGTLLTVGTQNNVQALLIAAGRPITSLASQTPAMTTPPYAASKSANQTGYTSGTSNDYLDSVVNSNGAATLTYDAVNTARSAIYNDQLLVVRP